MRISDWSSDVGSSDLKTLDPIRREKWLGEEWRSKIDGFKSIFRRNDAVIQGCQKALCLGARTGQEVVALEELGLDAIGIDLVPCPPHVEAGDIHNLRFEDADRESTRLNSSN